MNTSKLSPSDIPEEVEVMKNDSTYKCSFYYSIMEGDNELKNMKVDNMWSLSYSPSTGRIYSISYVKSIFKDSKKQIKELADSFLKNRIKDNIKFGLYLINKINEVL